MNRLVHWVNMKRCAAHISARYIPLMWAVADCLQKNQPARSEALGKTCHR